MTLSIRTRRLDLTDEIKEMIAHRLDLALDTFRDRVESVSVYVVDLNGPKGGVDKLCQVAAHVRGYGRVAVREQGSTLRDALNRATRTLKHRLLRETEISRTNDTIRQIAAA